MLCTLGQASASGFFGGYSKSWALGHSTVEAENSNVPLLQLSDKKSRETSMICTTSSICPYKSGCCLMTSGFQVEGS